MTRLTLVLLALGVALLAAPAAADIIPPGYRSVRHVLVLEDDERLAEIRLVLAPVRGFGGTEILEPGQERTFSGKYGTRVFALRADQTVPDDPKELAAAAFASGDLPVGEISSVPHTDRTREAVSTVRLDSIEGDEVVLMHVATRKYGKGRVEVTGDRTWSVMLGVGAVGLLLVILLLRRRRAKSA